MSTPLATNVLQLVGTAVSAQLTAEAAAPSAGAGVAANVGSLYLQTTGVLWIKTGAPDTSWTQFTTGSSTNLQVFRYTVTGGEGDLSDFFVPLPAARATDTYIVTGTCAGCLVIVPFDLPDLAANDRKTTEFRIIAASAFTAADQIDFIVSDAT